MPTNVPDFVVDHLRRYLDSNGEDGHMWNSAELQGKTHREIPIVVLEKE